MRNDWWRRNRLWVLLLAPLLASALAASSFRLVAIYQPWGEDHYADHLARTQPYHFEQDFTGYEGTKFHRAVDISLDDLRLISASGDWRAAPGGTLYRVTLTLKAAPDQMLRTCQIQLLGDDGTRYGATGGKVNDEIALEPGETCVPVDQEGPGFEPLTDVVKQSDAPRPEVWQARADIAVPFGTKITQVRIYWNRPEAVLLPVR
jgi:hypothetical protein